MNDTDDDLGRVVDQLLGGLEREWNAGDAEGFGGHFHADAEFVDVLGRFVRGREAIVRVHRRNFDSIHAGSRLRIERLAARRLGPDLALAHSSSAMRVPGGPLAGDSRATQTILLDNQAGPWRIRAFHNTFVREVPGVPAAV